MIGGLAVGIASSVSPMYMSEVSPKKIRGRALSSQNFAIVFGQVVIFVVNFLIAQGMTHEWLVDVGWRIMIGSEAIPCALFVLASFFIPESPRWLVLVGREKKRLKSLVKSSTLLMRLRLLTRFITLSTKKQKTKRKLKSFKFTNNAAFGFSFSSQP